MPDRQLGQWTQGWISPQQERQEEKERKEEKGGLNY